MAVPGLYIDVTKWRAEVVVKEVNAEALTRSHSSVEVTFAFATALAKVDGLARAVVSAGVHTFQECRISVLPLFAL